MSWVINSINPWIVFIMTNHPCVMHRISRGSNLWVGRASSDTQGTVVNNLIYIISYKPSTKTLTFIKSVIVYLWLIMAVWNIAGPFAGRSYNDGFLIHQLLH